MRRREVVKGLGAAPIILTGQAFARGAQVTEQKDVIEKLGLAKKEYVPHTEKYKAPQRADGRTICEAIEALAAFPPGSSDGFASGTRF